MQQVLSLRSQSFPLILNLCRPSRCLFAPVVRSRLSVSLPIFRTRLFSHSSFNIRVQRVRPIDVITRSVSAPWPRSPESKGKMSVAEAQETGGVRVAVEGCVSSDGGRESRISLTCDLGPRDTARNLRFDWPCVSNQRLGCRRFVGYWR